MESRPIRNSHASGQLNAISVTEDGVVLGVPVLAGLPATQVAVLPFMARKRAPLSIS